VELGRFRANVAHIKQPRPDQIVFSNRLDIHHKSPDSGERQSQSREPKTAIWSYSEGWWIDFDAFAEGTKNVEHVQLRRLYERIWHMQGSQGQILALVFKQTFYVVPASLGSGQTTSQQFEAVPRRARI